MHQAGRAILLSLLVLTGSASAAGGPRTVRVEREPLVLRLTVSATGNTVLAQASLDNTGDKPWLYYGGCAPPALQIRARDGQGRLIVGWKPPQVACMALALRTLDPGDSLHARTQFDATGKVYIRALVPAGASHRRYLVTPAVVLDLPAD